MYDEKIDIFEDTLIKNESKILGILLRDRTLHKKNIIWATNDYFKDYSIGYEPYSEIKIECISGLFNNVIQPRISKDIAKQIERTKIKGEVFTPSWICNQQNNLIDSLWFGRDNIFNEEIGKSWKTNHNKIKFLLKGKTWTKYVDLKRLEISCGEAPYLVSRYDNATGKSINIENRIGILDRKLRVVGENAGSKEEWIKWAMRAVQSCYGYEFQGDNVLIARENILYTFIDYFKYYLHEIPENKLLERMSLIISWNIWQMDGLTNKPPYIENLESESCINDLPFCKVMDWRENNSFVFARIGKKE